MKSVTSIYRRVAGFAASLALLGSFHSAYAASGSWLAAPFNNNWIAAPTTNNWSSGVGTYPGTNSGTSSPDIATFNANSSQTTVNCASGWVVGGITFDTANAAAYTINTSGGTWRVSLMGNANGAVIRETGTVVNKQTINGTLRLASTGTLSIYNDSTTTAATLNILGGCSVNNSGTSGTLVLGGANAGANIMGAFIEQTPASIFGTLIKTNAGTWILNTNNTYHANTVVAGGTLLLMGFGAIPNSANIIVNNGTLNISNVVSNPNNLWLTNSGILALTNTTVGTTPFTIGTLTVSNATLQLGVNGAASYTDISASTLNVGPHTTLAIAKVTSVTSPTMFTLINYGGADPNPANFIVTVPQGYSASPVSVGGGAVTVTITPPVNNALVWVGATNSVPVSFWDTNKTQNWIDAATLSVPQAYANPDSVQFDDTAVNSTVTLVTTNSPTTMDVNNYSLNYLFNGAGKISGSTALTKEGAATLTLADKGDDFSGGITVYGGTLVLDNTNGNISGGLTVGYGTTAQIGNNDNFGALPAGPVDIEGALIFQRANNYTVPTSLSGNNGTLTQNGNGVLTLNTTNSYGGVTAVTRGTLALVAGGAISNSPGLLVSNATFDVSALAGTTILNDFSIANATVNVGVTNIVTPIVTPNFEVDGITAVSNIINVMNLPTISSYPLTLTLIQSGNPINLANGNFNFVLGTLPAANPPYHGHLVPSADQKSVQLTLTTGPTGPRASVTWIGVDDTTTTTNWSDRYNWQLPGTPAVLDNVIFGPGNTTSGASVVDNVVDASASVATLTYNQTTSGQWHVTQIPAGNTLTVIGATTIGGMTADGIKTTAAMVDAGTLTLNNNLTIGNIGATTADSGTALDLSGLSNFVFNASGGSIILGPNNRSAANFNLAGFSNKVTAANISVNTASSSSSASGTMTLGAGTNILNVGSINVGGQRTSGTIQFPASASTAGLRMRGAAGTESSRANVTLGNRNAGSSSGGTTTGTLSFNGSVLDLKLGTFTLGVCNQASGLVGTGNLQFDAGTVDATSILMAVNSGAGAANGTITIGANGTLAIGAGGLSMGNQSSSGSATATLNVNGGKVVCNGGINKTTLSGTVANVTLTGGTLSIMGGTVGTLGLPIDNLTLNSGSTLELNYVIGSTNIAADSIFAGGPITVNVNSFIGLGTAPVEVPLIHYNNNDPYSSLVLGSVAPGYIVGNGGALVDNVANQTIDIIVTPPPQVAFAPLGGNSFQLSWPAERLGWRLEVQTNSLGAGLSVSNAWYTVPGSASVTSETMTVNPAIKGTVLYRLTYP